MSLFQKSVERKYLNDIISKTKAFQNSRIQFMRLLKNKFDLEKPTTKIQNWHELKINVFLKELQKAKIKLSLSEEAEWMSYFNEQKQIAQNVKSEIEKLDKGLDQMVYELYGLSEVEIKIVEGR